MSPFRALSITERTTLHRHKERGQSNQADLFAVLDAGLICHLGVVIEAAPAVLPTGYGRIGDTLYLHGSSANRSFRHAAGTEVCVTITLVDGLVCARSVFSNSVNYRSAVIYGTARLVIDEAERLAGLRAITEHLIPGRWANSRQPNKKEMAATSVLALPLDEASVKVRAGGPSDEDEDYQLDAWAGVLPISMVVGPAEPDPLLPAGTPVPEHIVALQTDQEGARPDGAHAVRG